MGLRAAEMYMYGREANLLNISLTNGFSEWKRSNLPTTTKWNRKYAFNINYKKLIYFFFKVILYLKNSYFNLSILL